MRLVKVLQESRATKRRKTIGSPEEKVGPVAGF